MIPLGEGGRMKYSEIFEMKYEEQEELTGADEIFETRVSICDPKNKKESVPLKNMMKFAAVVRVSEQCSPYDYEWNTYIKQIAPDTKLSDLLDWQKKTWPHKKNIQEDKFYYQMTIQTIE